MMRVTFTQINDTVLRNIGYNQRKMERMQEQLSSGRRLNRPSDDPIDMKNNIHYKAEIAQTEQFKRNIEDGQAWISMTEVTMTDMNSIVQKIRELAVQGSNDTMGAQERGYIGQEATQLLNQLVSLANTKYKGNFIFGGTNGDQQIYKYETGATHSFGVTAASVNTFQTGVANAMTTYANGKIDQIKCLDPNSVTVTYSTGGGPVATAIEGTDYTVDYANGTLSAVAGSAFETALLLNAPPLPANATTVDIRFNYFNKLNQENSGSINREIEEGVSPRINTSADDLFEDNTSNLSLIGVVVDMLDGLRNNKSDKVNNSISEIDTIFAKMKSAQSTNGARLNRFDLTLDRNANKNIEYTRLQSDLEDLDFAEAIMNFSMSENVYNASLRAGAKVILPTLGDYI